MPRRFAYRNDVGEEWGRTGEPVKPLIFQCVLLVAPSPSVPLTAPSYNRDAQKGNPT